MTFARSLWLLAYRRVLPLGLAILTFLSVLLWQPARTPSQVNHSPPVTASPTPEAATPAKPSPTPSPPVAEPSAVPSPAVSPSPQPTVTPESNQPSPQPTPAPSSETPDAAAEPEKSPEEVEREQKLIQADQLYLGGQYARAEALYREAKRAFDKDSTSGVNKRPDPIYDPAALSPGGRVYWRESEAGIQYRLQTRVLVPLRLLTQQYPQFIPGHLRLAQALKEYQQPEEALAVLERAATLYPNQPELVKARVVALGEAEQWMEASIAARQFTIFNPNHPDNPEFEQLADTNLERFQSATREKLTGNAIANFITGALGYALTGSLLGPFTAIETTALLLQGESGVGESVASAAKQELKMVEDPEVVAYINELGQRVATVAGRKDFRYEFYTVLDDKLNAFALPGGKVFVNAGAIYNSNSEAELAGLMAHEVSHAVLSHGFQLVTEGNLLGNVTQFIPLGGTLAQLFVLDYSREMERQADILGTRILTATGYAADGLRNLMVHMKKDEKAFPFSWLLTHPVTDERIAYLEELIQRNGYNRYAYEGVVRHAEMKARVKTLLAEYKKQQKEEQENR